MPRQPPSPPQDSGQPDPRAWALLAALFPAFVYGWRELYVPLTVVVHDRHGMVLVTAALAVAASRVGVWISAQVGLPSAARPAATVAGLALIVLGLVPEEGPLGLLLWGLFGLSWPVLGQALVARATAARAHEGALARLGLGGQAAAPFLWLILGLVLAGPLASGPGAWLVAAVCLLWAWKLPQPSAGGATERPEPQPVAGLAGSGYLWIPFLFSASYLGWVWLLPALLLDAGLPVIWAGLPLAAGWLLRPLGHALASSAARRQAIRWALVAAAALAALALLALSLAQEAWQLTAIVALHGFLAGVTGAHPSIARPEALAMPGTAQAAGEVIAPLLGALLFVAGGLVPVYAGAALAALGMAVAIAASPSSRS